MCTPRRLLDGDQVTIVIAEQGAEQVGLLEFELEASTAGVVGDGGSRGGPSGGSLGEQRARHAVGTGGRSESRRRMSPGAASVSTCTDWSQGDRPIIWPGYRPLRSIRTSVVLPNTRAVERDLMSSDPCLQALQAFVHDLGRDLVLHRGGGRARPRAILERIGRSVDAPRRRDSASLRNLLRFRPGNRR